MNQPVALTIAGSDPSGGAGIQADLKTFHQHRVYGMSVITLLTVQNTQTVSDVKMIDPDFVLAQIDAVISDIFPTAAKTGALGNAEVIAAVADRAARFKFPLVVDPVMISKHGASLIDSNAIETLKSKLLPHAFLITPNLSEAAKLTGIEVNSVETMIAAAKSISQLGPKNVFIKGGHLAGEAIDVLLTAGEVQQFSTSRIDTTHTHGTGCVTSAAITALLARGETVSTAVRLAKRFITQAIKSNPGLGHGFGPVNMLADAQ